MARYKVEYQDNSSLHEMFPVDPADFSASLKKYLESAHDGGDVFIGVIPNGSAAGHFIFAVEEEPTPAPVAPPPAPSAPTPAPVATNAPTE
jgi:hypothetical protein